MNIDALKYFYLIAKEGSISNVAKDIHLSQSALSQQILKLENDIGKKLLIRSNKGVALTAMGNIVYKFAESILRTYDKMVSELTEAEKGNIVVKIQACHSLADYALPCTLIKANGAYPNHSYELTSNLSNEIVSNVANNICNLGFSCDSGLELEDKDIVATKVGVNNIVLISLNKDSYPDVTTVDKLLDSSLITFIEKNNINNALIKNLQNLGYDQTSLNHNLRVEGIESAKMLVSRNYGVAFLPYISVKEELYKKQFKIIEMPEFNMRLDILMIYKQDCPPYVKDFISWFYKHGSKSFC